MRLAVHRVEHARLAVGHMPVRQRDTLGQLP